MKITATSRKKILPVLTALLLIIFFSIRWGSPNTGYPSHGWDFGAHFSIMEELKHGHFFPEIHSNSSNENSVASFMPLYSGILGAHFLTLILHFIFGLTLTKAMLVLSDIASIAIFAALYHICKDRGCSKEKTFFIFLVQILSLISAYASGFYSQTLGIAVGYWVFLSPPSTARKLTVLSAFIYPDILLWLLPKQVLDLWKTSSKGGRILALLLSGIFILLLAVLISRLSLGGSAEIVWIGYIALISATFATLTQWPQQLKLTVVPYILISSLILGISYLKYGQFRYYSRKPLFWTSIFLAYCFPYLKSRVILMLLMLSLVFAIIWDKDQFAQELLPVLTAKSSFPAQKEIEARNLLLQKNCANGVFLVTSEKNNNTVNFQILNSLTGRTDVARMKIRSDELLIPELIDLLDNSRTTNPGSTAPASKFLPQNKYIWNEWCLYCP